MAKKLNEADPTARAAMAHVGRLGRDDLVRMPVPSADRPAPSAVLAVYRTLRDRHPALFAEVGISSGIAVAVRAWEKAGRDVDAVTTEHLEAGL